MAVNMADQVDFLTVNTVMDILTSSSSEEDEAVDAILLHQNKRNKPKLQCFVEDIVNKYDEQEFKANLRISRSTYYRLVNLFKESQFYPKQVGGKPVKSAEMHLLAFLWYAGNKTVFRVTAQLFDLSESSAHRMFERVMNFLMNLAPAVIKLPETEQEKQNIADEFELISGFPGVVGCIDGTFIPLRTPAGKIKSTYINRHDQTSITLQAICDANKIFLDTFTGPPSKIHDARIYSLSFVKKKVNNFEANYHLLGDAAYKISENLMTPFRDYGNMTPEQQLFNKKLSQTRVKIENAFGNLKARFRQLMRTEFWTVEKTSTFILCCCVLHNFCIINMDLWEESYMNDEHFDLVDNVDDIRENILKELGELKRNRLAHMFITQ